MPYATRADQLRRCSRAQRKADPFTERMDSTHNPGRVAGFALTPRRLRPLPPHRYTQHSGRAWQATATANNIAAHELLSCLGIVSDLFCGAIVIFLVLAHYRLFKTVDQNLAVLLVILGAYCQPPSISSTCSTSRLRWCAARIYCRYLRNFRGTPWPCGSFVCTTTKSLAPRSFGFMAFSPSDHGAQVALSAPLPGRLADINGASYLTLSFTGLVSRQSRGYSL
jgi:hypothetical protein